MTTGILLTKHTSRTVKAGTDIVLGTLTNIYREGKLIAKRVTGHEAGKEYTYLMLHLPGTQESSWYWRPAGYSYVVETITELVDRRGQVILKPITGVPYQNRKRFIEEPCFKDEWDAKLAIFQTLLILI